MRAGADSSVWAGHSSPLPPHVPTGRAAQRLALPLRNTIRKRLSFKADRKSVGLPDCSSSPASPPSAAVAASLLRRAPALAGIERPAHRRRVDGHPGVRSAGAFTWMSAGMVLGVASRAGLHRHLLVMSRLI